jgi:hypothetical protein
MRLGSENRLDGIQNFGRFGSVFSKPFPTRQTVFRTDIDITIGLLAIGFAVMFHRRYSPN